MASKQHSTAPASSFTRATNGRKAPSDAALIRQCELYLMRREALEAEAEPFIDMQQPYSRKAEAIWSRLSIECEHSRKLLRELSMTRPKTAAGLVAQARIMMKTLEEPGADEPRAWSLGDELRAYNLADSVIRLLGEKPAEIQ
jgi:hypothetical protein